MTNKNIKIIVFIISITLCFPYSIFAGTSSRSSSSFSSSSRSSGSGGWSTSSTTTSKPSTSSNWSTSTTGKPTSPTPSTSGWSTSPSTTKPSDTKGWSTSSSTTKPSSVPTVDAQKKSSWFTTSASKEIRKEQSQKAFSDYNSKFEKKDVNITYKPKNDAPKYKSYDDYRRSNTIIYEQHHWTPPTYVWHSSPTFGSYDSMGLWLMLDSIHDAQMMNFYMSHKNDPDMQNWRKEAERLAESNDDLKKKLNDMDSKINEMNKNGIKPIDNVPDDVKKVIYTPNIDETDEGSSFSGIIISIIVGLFSIGVIAFIFVVLIKIKRRRTS